MAVSDQTHMVGLAIEHAAASSEKNGYIRGSLAKIWDCGTVSYTWPTGPQKSEIHARVTATVSGYQTAGARLVAARPIRVDFLVQAYRINPRASSEPVRAWTCDLKAGEVPEQHLLEEAFEQASSLAARLVDSLKVAGRARAADHVGGVEIGGAIGVDVEGLPEGFLP